MSADLHPGPAATVPDPWPIFDVTVSGYGAGIVTAPTQDKALAETWNSDVFSHLGFNEFKRIARARHRTEPLIADGYAYVRSAYGVDVRIGQTVTLRNEGERWNGREGVVLYPDPSAAHVHILFAGMDRAVIVHPDDVVPPRHPHRPASEARP